MSNEAELPHVPEVSADEPEMDNLLQLPPRPPAGFEMTCVSFKCGAKIGPGRKTRHFCSKCWALLPAHYQEAIKSEMEWLDARGQTLGDQATLLLFSSASNRIWGMRVQADPKLRDAWVREQQKKREAAEESARLAREAAEPKRIILAER